VSTVLAVLKRGRCIGKKRLYPCLQVQCANCARVYELSDHKWRVQKLRYCDRCRPPPPPSEALVRDANGRWLPSSQKISKGLPMSQGREKTAMRSASRVQTRNGPLAHGKEGDR
jgi:hypothetical protein